VNAGIEALWNCDELHLMVFQAKCSVSVTEKQKKFSLGFFFQLEQLTNQMKTGSIYK